MKLIKGRWWTTADLVSDSDGIARFRGFTGRYRVTVTIADSKGTREAEVVRGASNIIRVRIE